MLPANAFPKTRKYVLSVFPSGSSSVFPSGSNRDAMLCATKVYNGLLWQLREEGKERVKTHVSCRNLNRILKTLPRAKAYHSMSVQLTRDEVIQAWRSFFTLRRKGRTQHNAPGFRRKGYLSPLKYVQSGFRVKGDRVTVSLGTSRKDGVRRVFCRISHRTDVQYDRVRELSITYDKETGRSVASRSEHREARLVVEVASPAHHGTGRVVVDLGETVLLARAFEDGTALLYSGRLVKAIKRQVGPLSVHRTKEIHQYGIEEDGVILVGHVTRTGDDQIPSERFSLRPDRRVFADGTDPVVHAVRDQERLGEPVLQVLVQAPAHADPNAIELVLRQLAKCLVRVGPHLGLDSAVMRHHALEGFPRHDSKDG